VRKAWTWLAGVAGLAALARLRARRRVPAGVPAEENPAEVLRRKLADRREDDLADDEIDGEPDPAELDARRADVHARAQEAIDQMRDEAPVETGSGEPTP
jgi:hypothetical protein